MREQAIVQAGGATDRLHYHGAGASGAVLGDKAAGNLLVYEQQKANGHLIAVTDASTPKASRRFVNDTSGLTLASLQDGKLTSELVVDGDVLGRYCRERQSGRRSCQ